MSLDETYGAALRRLGAAGARVLAFSPSEDLAQAIVDWGSELVVADEDAARDQFEVVILPGRLDELAQVVQDVAGALAPGGRVFVPLEVGRTGDEREYEVERILTRAGLAVVSVGESLLEAAPVPVEVVPALVRLAERAASAARERLELAERAERAARRNTRLRSLLLDAHDSAVSRDLAAAAAKARPVHRPPDTRGLAACTIISRNYLAHARTLARTFLEHEPDGRFYLLVIDELPDVEPGPGIRTVAPSELGLSSFWEMCFKYDVVEFSTAVKPSLLSLLLNGYGEERVVYLDPDIFVAGPLAEVHTELAEAALVLTPHLLRPIPIDGKTPSERDILISGAYNLGFLALRRSPAVDSFLAWWNDRLKDGCRIDVAGGLFTDQKWVDLVPGIVDGVALLRDETYNVAFWNLHERTIERADDAFLVNGRALTFFHASGFDPENRLVLSKHQNRLRVEPGTGLAALLDEYACRLIEHGYRECSAWGYGHARFDNGIAVNPILRRLYLDLDEPARAHFGNPFATSDPSSFLAWATTPTTEPSNLSPFLGALYRDRFDVAAAFPDVTGADREAFLDWARNQGSKEMPYEPELVRGDVPRAHHSAAVSLSDPSPGTSRSTTVLPYDDLVHRVRDAVAASLPSESTVAVVSRGDEELVRFDAHHGWHFPQNGDGAWAGYYPRDGASAIAHLEALRARGADYLVVPETGRWWLEHPTYSEFGDYLRTSCRRAAQLDHVCEVFELREPARTVESDAPRGPRLLDRLRSRGSGVGKKRPA